MSRSVKLYLYYVLLHLMSYCVLLYNPTTILLEAEPRSGQGKTLLVLIKVQKTYAFKKYILKSIKYEKTQHKWYVKGDGRGNEK